MDSVLATRLVTEIGSSRASSPAFRYGTTCARCGGLMVSQFCIDLFNGTGDLEVEPLRCVQCGDIVDPVILHNRLRQQEALAAKLSTSVHSVRRQIAA